MDIYNTNGDRLGAVIYWLSKVERKCFSQKDLAQMLGYNHCYISAVRSGHFEMTDAFLNNPKAFEPRINIEWIRTGEGEMLVATDGIASEDAGQITGENFEALKDQSKFSAPSVGKIDFWVKMTNGSMMPRFITGDILACRRIVFSNDLRGLFLVVTIAHLFVARLTAVYDGLAIFSFDNSERFPRVPLETSSIKEIFQIVGLIRTEL